MQTAFSPMEEDRNNSRRKKKIILISVFSSIAAIAIISVAIYFAAFFIYPNNYRNDIKRVEELKTLYNQVEEEAYNYMQTALYQYSTQKQIDAAGEKYGKVKESFNNKLAEIGASRTQKDSEVAKSYKDIKDKSNAYFSDKDDVFSLVPSMRNATQYCSASEVGKMDTSDLSKIVESYDKAVSECNKSFERMSESKNPSISKMGKNIVKYFAEFRKHIVDMQESFINDDKTKFETSYANFLEYAKKFDSSIKEYSDFEYSADTSLIKDISKLEDLLHSRV